MPEVAETLPRIPVPMAVWANTRAATSSDLRQFLDRESHDTGMCFFTPDNSQIANYPNQHCENLTAKHQATNNKFKPLVRIFKNMRSKLIEDGLIEEGSAP